MCPESHPGQDLVEPVQAVHKPTIHVLLITIMGFAQCSICLLISSSIILDDSFFAESGDQDEAAQDSPLVYALYFAEDELYENEVESFISDLRLEYSIDVRTNLSCKEYAMNKQVFVFDSLMKADYVLIFCSPAFKIAEEHKTARKSQPSGINVLFLAPFPFLEV